MLKAVLIDCIPPKTSKQEAIYRLEEAENLIKTYGGVVLVKKIQKKLHPNYATYLGQGKIEEIIAENEQLKANIIIINNELKPRQTYNVSEMVRKHNLGVWDRVDLILKIFEKHASTKEARLEIQLASIKHMGPRIFGMGMELSRQAGGIGTRGVGETNIEFMRRHLKKMEDSLRRELEKCKKVRHLHRQSRRRKNLKTVGIIGYTNAGKTSLLNALTRKGAHTANQLFATLDTRVGKLFFDPSSRRENNPKASKLAFSKEPEKKSLNRMGEYDEDFFSRGDAGKGNFQAFALISDTIGFIQDLPTTLIESFRSTLEETIQADLLLHVIDINDPRMEEKIKTVNHILAQIDTLHKPTIYVFNKTDLLPKSQLPKKIKSLTKKFAAFQPQFTSTSTSTGIDNLKNHIAKML